MGTRTNILTPNTVQTAGFEIKRGWDEALAAQLVAASNEETIRRSTPRDVHERFASIDTANDWYASSPRVVYALCKAADLAGVVWFSEHARPDYNASHTFAVRLYQPARGQGLAQSFVTTCEDNFRSTEHPEGIWLETDSDNAAALHLYTKIGYQALCITGNRIAMMKP